MLVLDEKRLGKEETHERIIGWYEYKGKEGRRLRFTVEARGTDITATLMGEGIPRPRPGFVIHGEPDNLPLEAVTALVAQMYLATGVVDDPSRLPRAVTSEKGKVKKLYASIKRDITDYSRRNEQYEPRN